MDKLYAGGFDPGLVDIFRKVDTIQIKGQVPKRFTHTTGKERDDPIAASILARDFSAAAPNQRWISNTTEFVIGDGTKLYLAAILDLFSRFVVGVGGQCRERSTAHLEGPRDGGPAALSRSVAPAPLRSRLHVHVRGLSNGSRNPWHRMKHESARRLVVDVDSTVASSEDK